MHTLPLATAVTCLALSASASFASTMLVTDVYQMEINSFAFESNFWDRFDSATDADDPVPIDRISMTFEVSYLTPIDQALQFRDPVTRFAITNLSFTTNDAAGITTAETLTEEHITEQRASISRFGFTINARVGRDPVRQFDTHSLFIRVPDFMGLALGQIGAGSIFEVGINSAQSFDAPDYRGLTQDWSVQRLSSAAVPAPVPLPAAGGLLLGAIVLVGGAAKRRRRA